LLPTDYGIVKFWLQTATLPYYCPVPLTGIVTDRIVYNQGSRSQAVSIKEVSGMEAGKSGTQKAVAYDRKVLEEAHERAGKAYQEAKKQADIVYEAAKKLAVDKAAKQEVDKAHKEAIKEAEKVRDAIINEGMVLFTATWKQSEKDSEEAITKSKERGDLAQKDYKEAKKQADIVHEGAKKQAGDKTARQEADKAHKEAVQQAEKDYKDATGKSR
jgi:hypothetical protein